MTKRQPTMEEKKATPYGKVGIRPFNEVITAGLGCEHACKKVLRKVAFISSRVYAFTHKLRLHELLCIERPNSNLTIRSGFFFFHRGPPIEEQMDVKCAFRIRILIRSRQPCKGRFQRYDLRLCISHKDSHRKLNTSCGAFSTLRFAVVRFPFFYSFSMLKQP